MSRIYINAGLSTSERARLVSALADHELVWAQPVENVLAKGKPDSALASAEIAFGQPDPDAVLSSPSLRFVQLTSAGWTRYDRADLAATLRTRGTILCNASSVYAAAVAEHTIATMLALLRCLPEAIDAQRGQHEWRFAELRAGSRTLAGETVMLLGYGAIAREVVTRLRPFGARFIGFRRKARGDEDVPIVDDRGLHDALARADHIVDLLPESEATRGFVGAELLACCKPTARFYNVGRGATVDQRALREALEHGRLDAAWLDVTTPEPLPVDDALWTTPRLYVSPHTAGGHANEDGRLVDLFLSNLAVLRDGGPLLDRVL